MRRSCTLALPPFPHRGCSYCARNPCRGHYEQKPFPTALSDFLCSRAAQSYHISWLQGRTPPVVGVSTEKRCDHLAFSARWPKSRIFPAPSSSTIATVSESTFIPGQTLVKVPIFSGLTESELSFLAQRAVQRHYSTGESIFGESEPLFWTLCR